MVCSHGGHCRIYNSVTSPIVTNCIFWGNDANNLGDEIYNNSSGPTFSYCDVNGSGGLSGSGNNALDGPYHDYWEYKPSGSGNSDF